MQHIRISGPKTQRPPKAILRLPQLIQTHVDQSAQVVGIAIGRIIDKCLLDLVQCNGHFARFEIVDGQFQANTSTSTRLRLIRWRNDLRPEAGL